MINFWIVIGIVIGIILFTGISIKAWFYKFHDKFCPKIEKMDSNGKTQFKVLLEKLIYFKDRWFSQMLTTPKKWILFITLLLLVIGYTINVLSNLPFLRDILSFYAPFMDMLGIFFTGVTYIFSMIVGIFIYGDINNFIYNKNFGIFDKVINIIFNFLKYFLSYILPFIIIVSLIVSSAKSVTTTSEGDGCPSVSGNQIDPNIMNILFVIVFLLLLATYIVFNYLKCGELATFSQGKSFLFTLLVLIFVIIGNVFLVYFAIEYYTKLLTDTYLNTEYWIFFGCSILIYVVQTIRGETIKRIIYDVFGKFLNSFFIDMSNESKSIQAPKEVIATSAVPRGRMVRASSAPLPHIKPLLEPGGSFVQRGRGGSKKKKK